MILIMGDDVMVMECMPDYHQCWRSCISRDPPPLPPPSTPPSPPPALLECIRAHTECTQPNTTHLHCTVCTRMYITLFTLSTTWTLCMYTHYNMDTLYTHYNLDTLYNQYNLCTICHPSIYWNVLQYPAVPYMYTGEGS